MMMYIVVCTYEVSNWEGTHQQYALATRTAWTNRSDAEKYAASVHESRKPLVVECPLGVDFRYK